MKFLISAIFLLWLVGYVVGLFLFGNDADAWE